MAQALPLAPLFVSAFMLTIGGCGSSSAPTTPAADSGPPPWEQPVPKARCGPDDVVEPGLQGQVTLMERFAGFKGTHCNLQLVGEWPGEGAGVSHAAFRHCAYYSQAASIGNIPAPRPLQNPGVVVLDVSDSAHPRATDYLRSIAFIDPWESMKVNEKRQLLAAVNGLGSGGGPEFDVYDLSQDCAHPKLLASVTLANTDLKGHEGNWAPDGETYYGSDLNSNIYYAIDVKDPSAPKLIAQWSSPDLSPPNTTTHGLSLSADGRRGYFTLASGQFTNATPGSPATNGFYVLDTSDIQARKENPQVKVLATVKWRDGSASQHTIPVFIKGRPYLIHVDELGSGGQLGQRLRPEPAALRLCAHLRPCHGNAAPAGVEDHAGSA